MIVSFLLVAIAMVSSNEIGSNEQSLSRLARAANGGKETNCHYEKTQWSPCDEKTNVKVRTFTLKKGDETCEKTKKIEKKCKKGTIYIQDLFKL
jgi:hypothetical protein